MDWGRIFSKDWVRQHRYGGIGAVVGLLLLVAAVVLWRRKATTLQKAAAAAVAAVESRAKEMERQLAEREVAQKEADEAALLELTMPQVTSNKAMVLKKVLAENAKKDADATVQLLRSWIHEEER